MQVDRAHFAAFSPALISPNVREAGYRVGHSQDSLRRERRNQRSSPGTLEETDERPPQEASEEPVAKKASPHSLDITV